MTRKKEVELTHPERAHPIFTVEEAKDRERQRQRDKRARRKLEKSTALSAQALSNTAGWVVPVVNNESTSEHTYTTSPISARKRANMHLSWMKGRAILQQRYPPIPYSLGPISGVSMRSTEDWKMLLALDKLHKPCHCHSRPEAKSTTT